MSTQIAFHRPQLPWYPSVTERRRFRKILLITASIFLVFAVIIPLIDLPEPPRTQVIELPPRLARIIEQKKVIPPPPPKPVEEEVKKEEKKEEPKKEEKKEEPKKVEKKKEPPKEEKKKEEPKKVEKKKEEPKKSQVEVAREKVKKVGVLALSDALDDLRDASTIDSLKQDVTVAGSGANVVTAKKGNTAARAVTTGTTGGSGGISTDSVDRSTNEVAIASRSTSKVTTASASKAIADSQKQKKQKASAGGSRSQEEIQRLIEQNKGAFYRIYNRALRQNPALEGKVVFAITIDKTGAVSKVDVVASDLDDASLEAKLVARIKLINFGQQNVRTTTVRIPLDFFPA